MPTCEHVRVATESLRFCLWPGIIARLSKDNLKNTNPNMMTANSRR